MNIKVCPTEKLLIVCLNKKIKKKMAETVIYNTITQILKKLGSMVNQEIKLVRGVKKELHKLENTVSTIRAVLVDAEEQKATNTEVEDWLEKLNDVFYDADDLLNDFSTQILRRKVLTKNKRLKKVRNFFSSSNKMAQKIKAVRERLDAIAQDRRNFHLIERPVENTKKKETHSYVHPETVIGRDKDKTNIVEMLLNTNVEENVSVVAIVGIGGLGKTTLAQLVYNDEEVTKHFELMKWVFVSNPFDVQLIVQKIVGSEAGKALHMEELQKHLRTEIEGKRYLLVLDDMWNEDRDNWLELRNLLMGGSRGSKILVTTRNNLVANITGTNSLYFLEGLCDKVSWSLFKQMALKQGEEHENPCRVTMGKEIVQKCKGVPLAIKAIGSLLYSKNTDAEWLVFKDNDLFKIAQQEDVILPILKISYDYLPLNLKRCFAFCSLYLKDEKIYKKELIQLWIAEGLIPSVYENQQLEDVGDLYFMDLLRRSFFQDVRTDEWGEIISCKMHDLVHDVAENVARLKSSVENSDAKNVTERTRHVSCGYFVDSSWEIPTNLLRANKLRTFILKNKYLEETVFERIVSTYKYLRVLNMSNLGIEIVPSYISNLKRLKYLDLSGDHMKTLPSSITKLQNLETLKLNRCGFLKELPTDFRKLVSLRHLECEECHDLTGMPCGFGQLTSLSTLTRFVTDLNTGFSELRSLNNLRGRLFIDLKRRRDSSRRRDARRRWHWKNTAAAEGRMEGTNYLEAKQYLNTLELGFSIIDDQEVELLLESLRPHPNLKGLIIKSYSGVSFPSWMMVDKIGLSLPNLVRIHISLCVWKHLPLFGQLPSLQFLSLMGMQYLEYIDNSSGSGSGSGGEESLSSSLPSSSIGGGGGGGGATDATAAIRRSEPAPTPTFFPSLKQLTLHGLPKLKGWWRSDAAAEATTTAMTTTTLVDQQQHQQQHLKLPSFHFLSKLTIIGCPNLASMPILQPCLEELELNEVSKKLVEQELMMTLVSPTPLTNSTTTTFTDIVGTSSSSSHLPLSNLKSMSLWNIQDLGDDNDMQFPQGLRNLRNLSICFIPELVSLPVGLQHLTTLQTLQIKSCHNLKTLPEWIGNLTSLERLEIEFCCELTSLSDGMRQLTALQQLTITYCAKVLYDRCQEETGEDWPKIAHIQNFFCESRD
ncbi:putative disease resistance protein RGA4 isoform X2 [Cornus florida]|uniref:putative disease resistance protein RGA4 isoform X2 n=1 Tax=Cornus florida TaxID=4283 RepID=UPI00289AC676|nr:putative disease resistance protein RGA4 isoform X2 [Cornus florida]